MEKSAIKDDTDRTLFDPATATLLAQIICMKIADLAQIMCEITFQTVAETAAAESDVYVPVVYCALFASLVRRGISLSVSCLTASGSETEAKDVIQKNTDK
ncbi:MAG: hypothetical protein IKE58_06705 [Blautia sp.]|nr:hypothetical protein [Blautia sp.]